MPVHPDSHPPPPDFDVPAARRAAQLYRSAVARGVTPSSAWLEAVETFALHHPAWPWPMTEREAARTVGALLAWEAATAPPPPRRVPSMGLLRALTAPAVAGARAMRLTAGEPHAAPFRAAWRVPLGARLVPSSLPLLRLPAPPPAPVLPL